MANKLIAMPIFNAAMANVLTEGQHRAIEASEILVMLNTMPSQRVCVVSCFGAPEFTSELEKYQWVIFADNKKALDEATKGLADSHHNLRIVEMV